MSCAMFLRVLQPHFLLLFLLAFNLLKQRDYWYVLQLDCDD